MLHGWMDMRKGEKAGRPARGPAAESAPGRLRSLQSTNRTELRFRARLPSGFIDVEFV